MKNKDGWKGKESFIVGLLLTLYVSLALWAAINDGITADEIAHLPAGYSYLATGDYRMNYEHPPLIKLLSGFPLIFADIPKEVFASEEWKQGNDGEWTFGHKLLFESITSVDTLVFLGRLPIVVLGILLGLLTYIFSKELFGKRAALFTLALYVTLPEALTHGHLVTTDMGVALFILFAVFLLHRFHTTKAHKWLYACGVATGCALSAKFTGVYLLPILGLLLFAQRWKRTQKDFFPAMLDALVPFVKLLLLATLILVLTYKITQFPYYFKGLEFVSEHSVEGHQSYLLGLRSFEGWWWYFPVAFVLKTPLTMLCLLVLLAAICIRERKHALRGHLILLLFPVLLYFGTFLINSINIGVRHIFPIFPFLLIAIGSLATSKEKWMKAVLMGAVGMQVIATLLIAPHFISYFNLIAGGPQNGYNHLLDSNIDWGQDLKGLSTYLQERPLQPLYLAYFGNDNATKRGIVHESAPCYAKKGYYAVSVNQLIGIREQSSRCFAWLRTEHEPFDRIGYSILLYNITTDADENQQRLAYCEQECSARCQEKGFKYKESSWDQRCRCSCLGSEPN